MDINKFFEFQDIRLYNNNIISDDFSFLNNKIDLIVTSPPYNVDIKYDSYNDKLLYDDYLDFTDKYSKVLYNLGKDDCRICLNIPLFTNKNGIFPIYADILKIFEKNDWKFQTTVIWNKSNVSKRTAWGSWLSASAPYVIPPIEVILVMYKNTWKKINKGTSTINKDNFILWTNGLWTFPGETKNVKHPAPFPIELPKRCIELFSYKEDLILDPFVGSGTTLIASHLLNRISIGIDISKEYLNIAVDRINNQFVNLFNN